MLVDPSGSFYADWFVHLWLIAYHGAFFFHHGYFPEVIHTQQAVGMCDPAFYGRLPYVLVGGISAFIGPDLAARVAFFASLLLQFLEVWTAVRVFAKEKPLVATTVATLVCWTTYPLSNLFQRSSVWEFVAVCFLTSAVCRLFRLSIAEWGREYWSCALGIALYWSVAMLSHPITAMLGSVFLLALWVPMVICVSNRRRLMLASGAIFLLVSTAVTPWAYMIARFKSSLRIDQPKSGGLALFPFDEWWVRLWPTPLDPRTTLAGVKEVSTPYLDTQINVALLVLAMSVIFLGLCARKADRAAGRAAGGWLRRYAWANGVIAAGVLSVAFAFSVDSSLAAKVPPPLSSAQFACRLVTYCNLAILTLVLSVLVLVKRRPRLVVSYICFGTLGVALAGLTIKYIHISAVMNHASSWQTEKEVLRLPGEFYGLGDFSVIRTVPELETARPILPVTFAPSEGKQFGEVTEAVEVSVDRESALATNVVVFPWNQITVDGRVVPKAELRRRGVFFSAVVAPGRHRVKYRFVPDSIWVQFRRVSDCVLFALVLCYAWLEAGNQCKRRPFA
jgi:hypothetical protein